VDVAAQARAQRRVQKMGRGVVALRRAAGEPVHARVDALALVQLALLEHGVERLILAEADRLRDAARQSPSAHSITRHRRPDRRRPGRTAESASLTSTRPSPGSTAPIVVACSVVS